MTLKPEEVIEERTKYFKIASDNPQFVEYEVDYRLTKKQRNGLVYFMEELVMLHAVRKSGKWNDDEVGAFYEFREIRLTKTRDSITEPESTSVKHRDGAPLPEDLLEKLNTLPHYVRKVLKALKTPEEVSSPEP